MPFNRPALKAHVASDHTFGTTRQFVFTPTGPDNKSRAAIVLNENGHVQTHRSTIELSSHADALTRWARIYQQRSIPQGIAD